jgi:HlyD family secretion protein
LQTAQNSVDAANAALVSQQAAAAQSTAGPTQADIDAATAQVANAQAALQLAENDLQAATLVAPIDGTVGGINGSVGQYVSGNFITLSDLSNVQVSAAVSEADIGAVQPGEHVDFTVPAFPNRSFTGTVATVEPAGTTTSNVVTFTVLINVDPTDVQLLPDMTANVSITTSQQKADA